MAVEGSGQARGRYEPARVLARMAAAIAHRGPDDEGFWLDRRLLHGAEALVGLAHRRLAIVDLSPGGHQPMSSADGRYVLVFNGEIYNHAELRVDLSRTGVGFRSSSDTEVLVEAIAAWGVMAACRKAAGMFAFAVWDRREATLSLARDRMGKKPLYVYAPPGGGLAFASELKSLWALPGFAPAIDRQALGEFFRFGYVPEHSAIFSSVGKVLPGTVLTLGPDLGHAARTTAYWRLADAVLAGRDAPIRDGEEARQGLLERLRLATRSRMLADVPLGAFLSGGIDSGLVVSLMQEHSLRPVRTFSIAFADQLYDEAPVARAVARHLGTEHSELRVTEAEAQDVVPQLPEIFDEPFADASQIPTYLLARLTRGQVTVALTGDGGDEPFGGYARYRSQYGLAGALHHLPRPLRAPLARGLGQVPGGVWDSLSRAIPARRRPRFLASKVAKLSRSLALDDPARRAQAFLSFWEPEILVRGWTPGTDDTDGSAFYACPALLADDPAEAMQYWEILHYLPGDLLAKVDRATMAVALEARSPLLDHRVVEYAWRLPSSMKASRGASKRILRELLFGFVPREIVDLPKQGFSAPIGAWMAGDLRGWAEAVLAAGRERTGDLLDWQAVDSAWQAHLAGRAGVAEKMWSVLMFCAWQERWSGASGAALDEAPARRASKDAAFQAGMLENQ
jgi:asparagine synthase (glutamine-hydrolysing)